jgi:cation transport regulator
LLTVPYQDLSELPENVTGNLPVHAQRIYLEAYNSAWDQYADPAKRRDPDRSREATAHAVAWSAVESQYSKDQNGHWRKIT